jgi:hypothetical protein
MTTLEQARLRERQVEIERIRADERARIAREGKHETRATSKQLGTPQLQHN